MIHSTFDAFAQFLHRKTEQARQRSLKIMGPRLGPWVHGALVTAVVLFVLYLVLLLIDTMFDLGFLPFARKAAESLPGGGAP